MTRPMTYAQLVARSTRYGANDPRCDDRLQDAEGKMFAECMGNRDCVQDALETVYKASAAEFNGYEMADALIAGDECAAGKILHTLVREAMKPIAAARLEAKIDGDYADAMEHKGDSRHD